MVIWIKSRKKKEKYGKENQQKNQIYYCAFESGN